MLKFITYIPKFTTKYFKKYKVAKAAAVKLIQIQKSAQNKENNFKKSM